MHSQSYQGLQLPAYKQDTRDAGIVVATTPGVLVLPLNQHSDGELQPCVKAGDAVLMGQTIALPATPLGACLHAPVSGVVQAIELHAAPQSPTELEQAIVLANDGRDTPDPSLQPLANWQSIAPVQLCEHLARGGIVGLGGAAFPAATKLAVHAQQPIEYLLINGVECEPFISCDDRLMRERAGWIAQGAQIMLHAAQTQQCIIAVEADKPEALTAIRAALQQLADVRINAREVATAYPSGDEGQLITQLLDRKIPRGGLPAQIGVIVQNVATACACAQWIHAGMPLISRIVTVTGDGIRRPGNLQVRLGTALSDLIDDCGGYQNDSSPDALIMGGAMMGRALPHDRFPIVKASNCLIVTRHGKLKPALAEMPCIRCGECAQACPVNLLPQQLLAYARSGNQSALQELGLPDCIECGCCDYVCPSHIMLAGRFRAAKQTLRN